MERRATFLKKERVGLTTMEAAKTKAPRRPCAPAVETHRQHLFRGGTMDAQRNGTAVETWGKAVRRKKQWRQKERKQNGTAMGSQQSKTAGEAHGMGSETE